MKRESAGGSRHAESSGTRGPGDFGAMLLVEKERKYMRRRAGDLKRALRAYVDGEDAKQELAE